MATDPLTDVIRALLGDQRPQALDDPATLAGEEVVGWSDAALASEPEPFGDFDRQRAAEALAWEHRTGAAENSFRADEDMRVLRGLLRTDPSPELERRLSEAARSAAELDRERERFYDEMEEGRGVFLVNSFEFHLNFAADEPPESALVFGLAKARERAIRDPASAVEAGGPAPQYREIGTGNLAEIRERQRAARAYGYPIRRDGVPTPSSLAELRRFIGHRRYKTMARRAEPLVAWLADRANASASNLCKPARLRPRFRGPAWTSADCGLR